LFTPLVNDLAGRLYNQPVELVQLMEADAQYPGTLTYYHSPPALKSVASPFYTGKIVILVNEQTFGLAELTALALRKTPGAVVMGSQTAGAYGNVSSVALPGGIMATFTGQGALYPDGTSLQRTGVKIDVEVKPTLSSLQKGRDELLDHAIRFFKKSY
jgi:C-terminal processing protease CtpA/Prc